MMTFNISSEHYARKNLAMIISFLPRAYGQTQDGRYIETGIHPIDEAPKEQKIAYHGSMGNRSQYTKYLRHPPWIIAAVADHLACKVVR